MDLAQALATALQQQQQLIDKRAELDDRLAEIDVEIRGLRMALERHHHGVVKGRVKELEAAGLPRTDAIERVLQEAGRPLSPAEVVDRLHNLGRDDDYNPVSAALVHLAKSDRAHSVGRGQWVAGPGPGDGDGAQANRNRPGVSVHRDAKGGLVVTTPKVRRSPVSPEAS